MNIDYSRYANALSEAFQEKSENVGAEERSKQLSEALTGPFTTDLVRETIQPIIQRAIGTATDVAKGAVETVKQTASDTVKGALQTAKQTLQKAVQPTINEAERALQATQDLAQQAITPDLAEDAGESLARSAETSFGAQTITEDVVPEVSEELGQVGGRVAGQIVSDIAPEAMEFTPTLTNLAESSVSQAIDAMPASESLMARLITGGQAQTEVGDVVENLPDLPGLQDSLAPMRELMRRTQPPIEEEEPYELPPRPAETPPETSPETPPELGDQAPPTIEDAGQQASQEIGQAAEGATAELGEAGAQAAEGAVKDVAGNVAKSIGGALEDAAEGSSFLDEIPGGAVVTGLLALGSLFAGIFGHANEAQSINPSTQFGVGF